MSHDDEVERLFERARERDRLDDGELDRMVENARSPEYWRGLSPELSVEAPNAPEVALEPDDEDSWLDRIVDRFAEDGYFDAGVLVTPAAAARMRAAVETLRRHGWPPVFLFAYDEPWLATRSGAVRRLAAELLGEGFGQLPNFWAHYVSESREGRGWVPHVDGTMSAGRMSLWLPLGDATTHNGCMYVVPKSLEPASTVDAFATKATYSHAEVAALLQASRALPAPAGSVLGWNFGVIHWGSYCQADAEPRVSMAVELIAPGAPTVEGDLPLIDVDAALPSLEERLRLIARGIGTYRRFEASVERFARLAERLA